jgi:hypothetical protein
MARLLRDLDYLRVIQADNLAQVIEDNEQIKLDVEQAAQAEMISYLSQRYVINQIFTNTSEFSISATYKGKNLVEYHEPLFNLATVYNPSTRVSFAISATETNIYECSSTTTAGQTPLTHPAKWTLITEDYSLYYAVLPELEYSSTNTYAIGDQVWYNDTVYTCAISCLNVLPTTTAFWTVGSAYSFTGQLPTNTTYWTKGDNRNQQVVLYLLDITLYHLHSRINPRNIPDIRKERYDGNSPNQTGGAIAWLKRCGSGDITADLPNIDPQQGMSIRWGNSNGITTRASNTY